MPGHRIFAASFAEGKAMDRMLRAQGLPTPRR